MENREPFLLFHTPPAATGPISHALRYINNLTGRKDWNLAWRCLHAISQTRTYGTSFCGDKPRRVSPRANAGLH